VSALPGPRRAGAEQPLRLTRSARNQLVAAKFSGNLESFDKGLRGQTDDLVFNLRRGCFLKPSPWHEYGVGFGRTLGVVPEARPAFWMAEWDKPVTANLIVLSGTYPNQPQPATGWKIELRRHGRRVTRARGVGGWYNCGRYVWGGGDTAAVEFDAIRVSVFSKDAETPLRRTHFRGEPGLSWIVARLPPVDACIETPRLPIPIRAGERTVLAARTLSGAVRQWRWDFGDGRTGRGQQIVHTFSEP